MMMFTSQHIRKWDESSRGFGGSQTQFHTYAPVGLLGGHRGRQRQ